MFREFSAVAWRWLQDAAPGLQSATDLIAQCNQQRQMFWQVRQVILQIISAKLFHSFIGVDMPALSALARCWHE